MQSTLLLVIVVNEKKRNDGLTEQTSRFTKMKESDGSKHLKKMFPLPTNREREYLRVDISLLDSSVNFLGQDWINRSSEGFTKEIKMIRIPAII